jgi:hypothetical protein
LAGQVDICLADPSRRFGVSPGPYQLAKSLYAGVFVGLPETKPQVKLKLTIKNNWMKYYGELSIEDLD